MIGNGNEKIAEEIWSKILTAKKILLHLHVSMDGDSIGSTLAMRRKLVNMGKEVDLITGDNIDVPKYLKFLVKEGEVTKKEWSEVNFEYYDYFLSLDTASVVQITRRSDFLLPIEKTLVIDHHKGNTLYGAINLILPEYVSTCDLLVNFFETVRVSIDSDMCPPLYAGITTDSGNFIYPPTGKNTFESATRLLSINPEAILAARTISSNISLNEFMCQQMALKNLEFWFDKNIAVCWVCEETLVASGYFEPDFGPSNVSSLLSKLSGVKAGIALLGLENGTVRISMRSKNATEFNVRKLAEQFSIGGGHDAAAGATFNGSVEEALEFLKKMLEKKLNNTKT